MTDDSSFNFNNDNPVTPETGSELDKRLEKILNEVRNGELNNEQAILEIKKLTQ